MAIILYNARLLFSMLFYAATEGYWSFCEDGEG